MAYNHISDFLNKVIAYKKPWVYIQTYHNIFVGNYRLRFCDQGQDVVTSQTHFLRKFQ